MRKATQVCIDISSTILILFQGPKGAAGINGTDGEIGDEGKMGAKVTDSRQARTKLCLTVPL